MAYKIGDTNWIVPEEVTYRQYWKASKLLEDIDFEKFRKSDGFDVSGLVKVLFGEHKIPKLFSILLVPEGGTWKEEMEKNEVVFMDIGDKTATGIIEDFLSGRGSLIENIIDFFSSFLKEKTELITNSKVLKKAK